MDPISIGAAVAAIAASIGWFKSCRTVTQHQENNKKLADSLDTRKRVGEELRGKSVTVVADIDKIKKINEDSTKDLEKLKSDFQKLSKDNEEYKKRVEAIKAAPT
ncbi:unnamed protein product [Gordionus sp. m RMFG-2023]